jgi:hypothetical protein
MRDILVTPRGLREVFYKTQDYSGSGAACNKGLVNRNAPDCVSAVIPRWINQHQFNERSVMKKILAALFAMFFASAVMAATPASEAKPAEGAKPAAHKVVKHKKVMHKKMKAHKKAEHKKVEKKVEAGSAAK